ncbi:MAG: BatD family protein [Alphaproteobacteria bacterium]|nr:BatD family protein [Alphaproteobacteria bacterium]
MMRFWVVFLIVLFNFHTACAENFVAKVNRNTVPFGETFILTLQYDGNPGNSEPDLTPLKKDFTIYSVGRDYQRRSINGTVSHTYQWNVALAPKISGTAIIPEIAFKNLSSHPIKIKIGEESASSAGVPKFAIARSVNNTSPFVQEQIIYTLVLKTTEDLRGKEPIFDSLGSQDWIIKRISEPFTSSEIDNGIEVKKLEIKYAMFPQKSGTLKTPEVYFKGYYIDKNKNDHPGFPLSLNAFMDDSFMNGFGVNPAIQTVNLTAQPLDIEVKPVPKINNSDWWLPSSSVVIVDSWEQETPSFKVGEATNRQITLTAIGVAETQLPVPALKEVKNLKQYPDKPEYDTSASEYSDDVISALRMNIVYIPEEGGEITVPEISVPWYNLKTSEMNKAILQARTFKVAGNKKVPAVTKVKEAAENPRQEAEYENSCKPKSTVGLIFLSFAAGLGSAWLILRLMQLRNQEQKKEKPAPEIEIAEVFKNGSLQEIRDAVIRKAREISSSETILNLQQAADVFANEELKIMLQQIDAALYAGKKINLDAKKLTRLLKTASSSVVKKKKQKSLLPELYK